MTNFEIAKRFCGIPAAALAQRLGVSPQQLNGWLKGARVPSRTNVDEIAAAMGVDPAWLLGVPQRLPLIDPLTGDVFSAGIIRSEDIPDYGTLYHVYLSETGDIVPVILSTGIQLTPTDWTALTVRSAADIAECSWMGPGGRDAIMLDGLPRVVI